jgi:hypothetical protein
MNDPNYIRDKLFEMQDIFPRQAIELCKAMFGTKPVRKKPWTLSEFLRGDFEYIFSMDSDNETFRATTAMGIACADIPVMTGHDYPLDLAKDALTEFSNIYFGVMMDQLPFVKAFGLMQQEVPEDAIDRFFFPRAWCVSGLLSLDDSSLYFGFAVRENVIHLPI